MRGLNFDLPNSPCQPPPPWPPFSQPIQTTLIARGSQVGVDLFGGAKQFRPRFSLRQGPFPWGGGPPSQHFFPLASSSLPGYGPLGGVEWKYLGHLGEAKFSGMFVPKILGVPLLFQKMTFLRRLGFHFNSLKVDGFFCIDFRIFRIKPSSRLDPLLRGPHPPPLHPAPLFPVSTFFQPAGWPPSPWSLQENLQSPTLRPQCDPTRDVTRTRAAQFVTWLFQDPAVPNHTIT